MTFPTRAIHTDALQFGIDPVTIDSCRVFCPVTWSDLYKDAHGIRPRQSLAGYSAEQLDALWERTIRAKDEELERERAAEREAVARFDALVERMIGYGARDYATAVRWIADGDDLDFVLWEHGICDFTNTSRIRNEAGL